MGQRALDRGALLHAAGRLLRARLFEALRQDLGASTPVVQDTWRGCGTRVRAWITNQGKQPLQPGESAAFEPCVAGGDGAAARLALPVSTPRPVPVAARCRAGRCGCLACACR
jgi:hypothetical protein